MVRYRRENTLPGWLWFFLILPMVLIVALLYRRRRLPLPMPRLPGFGEQGVQRYVEPDSIPLDMSDVRQISVEMEPIQPIGGVAEEPARSAPVQIAGQPEDLKVIEGIGPSIERLLHSNGVNTYRDLASAPVEQLVEILTSARLNKLADPGTWPEQAQMAAEGRWEDLSAFQRTLKAGRRGSAA